MRPALILMAIVFFSFTCQAQVKTGHAAPEISLPGVNDSIIKLSSLKGKVVLIDFWASWCSPCRVANLRIEKLYQKYKDSGFEVYSVSIDSKKSSWLKAIAEDNITYIQVNDNKGWDANVTARYDVNAIPSTFLLDKKGTVVAIDPEGRRLEKKLKELLQ